MGDLQDILRQEKNNDRLIHLYKVGRYWFAFERSAFRLFSVFCADAIFKIKDMKKKEDSMLIAVLKDGVHHRWSPQFTVLERTENEMLIDCRTTCGGFLYWKDSLIPLFTENLHPKPDGTSHHISHLNLEKLLSPIKGL